MTRSKKYVQTCECCDSENVAKLRCAECGIWMCLHCVCKTKDRVVCPDCYRILQGDDEDSESSVDFESIGQEVGKLVAEKNRAYGDSFKKCAEFLRLLYPQGVKPEQYGDVLTLVRMFDKMMRIATDKDALGESPYRDLAGYSILGVAYLGKKEGGGK